MVNVKVPEAAITPLPEKNVWKLPKLEPVGVFRLVDPRPVNVIMRALPIPPRKVTELVPLPEHPPQVKVPDVEKVTGSALASDVAIVTIASSNAAIRVALKGLAMLTPLLNSPRLCVRTCPRRGNALSMAFSTRLRLMHPQPRDKRDCGNILFGLSKVSILTFSHNAGGKQPLLQRDPSQVETCWLVRVPHCEPRRYRHLEMRDRLLTEI